MTETKPDFLTRIANVRKRLADLNADAMLVSDVRNVRYLTGFTGDSSFLLIDGNDALMLSDGRYDVQLEQECSWLKRVIRPPAQKIIPLAAEVLGKQSHRRVAIEAGNMTVESVNVLKSLRPDIVLVETTDQVETLRQVKDDYELGLIRRAAAVAQQAMTQTLSTLNESTTERQFALDLEIAMRTDGADGVSFDVIAGFGETGALCHYRPGNRPLAANETLLFDWGAKVDGYASDITRTFHRGKPSDRFRAAYDAVLESQLAAIDAIRPGAQCSQIDAIARGVLEKHGLADAFLHSLGHGIGLNIHEGPRLAENSTETLQPGMIVTVEPGVYFGGDFGIRIEDDVLVTQDGAEVITSLPKGLDDCRLML